MAEELKACPFCGGGAEENWGGCAEFYGHEHQSVTIECTKCSASISIETCCEKEGSPSKGFEFSCCCCNPIGSVARSRWNTRAQLPSQGGEAVAKVSVWNIDPWYATDPRMAGRNIGVKFLGDHAKTLVDGQSLYTHPADQVEDDLIMVKVSRELLQDLRDLAFDQVEHHRAAMGAYKQTRQESMDHIVAKADALLAKSGGMKR